MADAELIEQLVAALSVIVPLVPRRISRTASRLSRAFSLRKTDGSCAR